MRRFFIDQSDIHDTTAILKGPDAHHLRSVLRLKPDATICLFDGAGTVYHARVVQIRHDTVETRIISTTAQAPKGHCSVYLGQGILKGKKMDMVVQKATELGIDTILPFTSQHCAVKKFDTSKEDRWKRIAIEACKQCNRPTPPACLPAADFNTLLATKEPFDRKLIFWEKETDASLHDIFTEGNRSQSVMILIGPEGGFSDEECDKALSAGFLPVTLGRRILRAETASIAAMAILQYLLGNLGG